MFQSASEHGAEVVERALQEAVGLSPLMPDNASSVIDQSQDSLLDEDAVKESLMFSLLGEIAFAPGSVGLSASIGAGQPSETLSVRAAEAIEDDTISRDAEHYISHLMESRVSALEAESRTIVEDTLDVYCPYLVRRALLTDEEKKIEDLSMAYILYVANAETQHEHHVEQDARRANFVLPVSDERILVEKAVDAYIGYLTEPKAVAAREQTAVRKCVETYCPMLVSHSQMDREKRSVSDATTMYARYLVQTPAERAAFAAAEARVDAVAAATYTNALVLRTSQRVLAESTKTAGPDARTYVERLVANAVWHSEVRTASMSAIVYTEVLLWNLALEASPSRQTWMRRVEQGRVEGARVDEGKDMLAHQAAAQLSAAGRSAVAGALKAACSEYMLAAAQPNEKIAGEWAALLIQSELAATESGRPISPFEDEPMEHGLAYIERQLKGTEEMEPASTVFMRIWDARAAEAEVTRVLRFLLGAEDEVLALSARLREAQASADTPSSDPLMLANLLVASSLGDAAVEAGVSP